MILQKHNLNRKHVVIYFKRVLITYMFKMTVYLVFLFFRLETLCMLGSVHEREGNIEKDILTD